jgi:two-component system sensor kinase FixL
MDFSPAAEQMFGHREEEVLGESITALIPAWFAILNDEPGTSQQNAVQNRGGPASGIRRVVRGRRKTGEVFVAELVIGEMRTHGAQIFSGFVRDITDQAEAVRKANALQRALDQVSRIRMLGEMSTALAHEISQPLAAISNLSRAARRLIDQNVSDLGVVTSHLDKVAEQAQRAGEIIRRMRQLVDRGSVDLRAEDINSVVQEAVHLCRISGTCGGVSVVFELAPGLPPVLMDSIQIQQVLVNLLRNAEEALNGGKVPDVHITTALNDSLGSVRLRSIRGDEETITVTISDTGPGLPDEMLEQMFEPFMTRKNGGLGVGLAVCRSIIEAHGGRIWAENNQGGGADIHFTLRVAPS